MGMQAIIDDGYTRRSGIKGVPGMYPAINFTWRGQTVRGRAKFKEATDRLGNNPVALEEAGAEIVARHILEWDVTGPGGQVAPITRETVFNLHPAAFNRLYAIVSMYAAPDWDEDPSFGLAAVRGAESATDVMGYLEGN